MLAIFAAYTNTLSAPFVFDDWAAIVENESIRDWRAPGRILSPPLNTGVSGRPVVNASLALNYALGGLEPRGYHVFNVLLHAGVALVLFGVTRRTLRQPALATPLESAANYLALGVAGVWALHPLLTESVTGVVQRNEIIVAWFYLLTLYAFIRSVNSGRPRGWRALAILCCALGMLSKEVMVSAPLIVWLYDRTFVVGSFGAAWRRSRGFYAGLAATWLVLATQIAGADHRGGTVGFGLGVSGWEYLLTQCRAIGLYLKLSFWPDPLVLDYGTDVVKSMAEVAPAGMIVLALVAAVGVALRRAPALGFAGCCFLVLLAPSSSFVPLTTQTIAEHRMYLPLAAIVAVTVIGLFRGGGRRTLAAWPVVAAGLAALTIARNRDYRSELALWEDTVEKRPENARARNNLGLALIHAGRLDEARGHLGQALVLAPEYAPAHANLADVMAALGQSTEAIAHYREAIRLSPGLPLVHHRYGIALFKEGRAVEAIGQFETAVRIRPDYAEAHNNLGTALISLGRIREARAEFETALRLQPDYDRARTNLGKTKQLESRSAAGP